MRKILLPAAVLLIAAFSVAQGHGGHGGFRFQGSDGGSLVQLALRPDVQKELVVTDDEKTKLTDLEARMQAAVVDAETDLGNRNVTDPNEQRNAIGGVGDKFAGELPNILTADQAKRLRQLLVQRNGYGAIQRKDLQDELGLTDDQKATMAAAEAKLLSVFDSLRTSATMDPKMMRQTVTDAIDARNKTLEGMLTADQKAKFEAIKGTPFTFDDDAKN